MTSLSPFLGLKIKTGLNCCQEEYRLAKRALGLLCRARNLQSCLDDFHPNMLPNYMLGPARPTILTLLLYFCFPTKMGTPKETDSWSLALAGPEEPSGTEVGMANTFRAATGGHTLLEVLHYVN